MTLSFAASERERNDLIPGVENVPHSGKTEKEEEEKEKENFLRLTFLSVSPLTEAHKENANSK